MIKIENTVSPSPEQWEAVVRGVRNPFNSWDKGDSYLDDYDYYFNMGKKDLTLMNRLANAGDDHGKFMRMLPVTVDITAPFFWWKQMDTYKVGTVADSCSTMHRLLAEPFKKEDFSIEHLPDETIEKYVDIFNTLRDGYINTKDNDEKQKYWDIVNALLPNCYNQRRTWFANYQVLKHIYNSRKNHKLKEWHDFCDWIETLPYAKEIILGDMNDD